MLIPPFHRKPLLPQPAFSNSGVSDTSIALYGIDRIEVPPKK